ncbi:MAG: LLM class flavin-dependent oxidoreductase [Planctomycetota bacterium]
MAIQIGLWQPVFGGWLRNVEDERMDWQWSYQERIARLADELGFATLLVAELNLNDTKGHDAPTVEAWTTIAAIAAVTERIELLAALRPGFRSPAIAAKMAANIDRISGGRFAINLVSAWWQREMEMYAGAWLDHADRYRRSSEFVSILRGGWREERFTFEGGHYATKDLILSPKPVRGDIPIYAGGESDEGRDFIAKQCDFYLMHGDRPEVVAESIAAMRERREKLGLPDMKYGIAAYIVQRDTEAEARAEVERITDVRASARSYDTYQAFVSGSKLRSEISVEDYSVSNRGLRPGLVGTRDQILERLAAFEAVGVDLVLAQCSPMHEEVQRLGEDLLPALPRHALPVAVR